MLGRLREGEASSILLALGGIALLVVALLLAAPSGEEYSIAGGLRWLADKHVEPVYDPGRLETVNPAGSILVVLWPGEWNTTLLLDFAYNGGIVILLGPDTVESLSPMLGGACSPGGQVRDPLYYSGTPGVPLALTVFGERIAIPGAVYMRCDGWEPWAWTSNFSYLDLDLDGSYSSADVMDSYVVGWSKSIGDGTIIALPSRSVVTGNVSGYNSWLLEALGAERILVDQTAFRGDLLERARAAAGPASTLEALLAAFGVVVVGSYVLQRL